MIRLSVFEWARITAARVEGNSLCSTSRLRGKAFNAVLRPLPDWFFSKH